MKAYNIYYNNTRINNKPLTLNEVKNNVLNKDCIFKQYDDYVQKINVKDIKIIETTLI